jgi:hypothetical protein
VKDGETIFIEVKSKDGKLSSTQLETQDEIVSYGGIYIITGSPAVLKAEFLESQ